MITVIVSKDSNMVKYISEIRKYDSTLSIGDIRNAIMNGTPVLTHKLIGYDFSDEYVNGIDRHTRNRMFLDLLKRLEAMGAVLDISKKGKSLAIDDLAREIGFVKEIADDVEKYPD